MRISDIARKLGIKTEELRAKLAEFGVAEKTLEIDAEKSDEIVKNWGQKKEEDEGGANLMGMVFDEEPEEKRESEQAEEKETPKKELKTDVKKSEESEKPANAGQEAARMRWARAKKASEKLISRKVKKLEKEKVKRISRQQERLDEAMADTSKQAAAAHGEIKIGDAISVRELAEKMGVSPIRIVGELLKNGVMANLNQIIDFETAAIVCEAFKCKVAHDTSAVSGKEILKGNIAKLLEDEPENLVERPPIIAVMGHVDHGKTTLLDAIRKTNVVEDESGGITQHIGAYQVEVATSEKKKSKKLRKVTFLDTPGHEAFTTMRARGARATDIAIIVVAAEEGIKPQTIEAINHARAADVPIIIAITKIDKPSANIEKVKGELAEHDLQATDWGGKTEIVPISAKTGKGVDDLLEIILLTNDVDPVKANPNRDAVGTVIESRLDKSLGPVATVLVNTGTLRAGDNFVIGPIVGKVKKMFDWNQKTLKTAEPGMPVLIAGLSKLPQTGVGEILQVLPNGETAKKKATEMQKILDATAREKTGGMSQIIGRINSGNLKELKIVLKTDVEGSLEAISENIAKIGNEDVKAKIIHSGVGNVSETDVLMAAAADGFLVAFHAKVPPAAAKLADYEGVTIRQHTIIYKVLEEIEKMLNGLLDPEEIETTLGQLEVRGIFFTKGKEQTVGGMVKSGKMVNGAKVRIFRDEKLVDESRISSLKREKENAHEVKEGFECGLKLSLTKTKIAEGDIVEAWMIEKKERKL